MPEPLLVIVSGLPCTGKTTLALRLAADFRLPFINKDAPRFLALKQEYPFVPLQIVCHADGEVLLERFKRRSESGIRHPGHVDGMNYAEFEQVFLAGEYEPLPMGGDLLAVDTTDFDSIDYAQIKSAVASVIKVLP